MVEVIHQEGQRVPVLLWNRNPPPAAVRQLQLLAAQPWVVDQVAGMPDLHLAEGVAVGTVFATEHHAIPGALGGDLGCGVAAQRFRCHVSTLDRRQIAAALAALDRAIPTGNKLQPDGVPLPEALAADALSTGSLRRAQERLGPLHLGTLGGGNHFLELAADAGGALWLLVHTGSRGLGAAVREHHEAAARSLDGGTLAALDVRSPAGQAYLDDMSWAQRFARANREHILQRASAVLAATLKVEPEEEAPLDVHHNFLAREEHRGRPVLVHRKGAVAAPQGAQVLIPGSMGTATYLAEGRGDPRSFGSCSHGAGRVMSRAEARASISPRSLEVQLRGVVFDHRKVRSLVEEAPAAYRDIREVLQDQEELVLPRLRMEPLGTLKG
ncbi:MAG: RtcB family protein [Polyangiaceae bacterium]|jgi:tRNA-splicing ligase RtcB|nr:RtcB family protein [Polyangiaceae bacterium]